MICHKNRYNNGSQLYSIIFKRLYDLRGVIDIKRTFRTINIIDRILESRTNS